MLGTALIGLPGIGDATLGWSDAPLHLFDGVFLLEFFRSAPSDARAWAEQFYLRHPAIGIGVYYPPGFAAIEAIVFSIFGVSIVAARALVVAFAAGACVLLYSIGKNWFDRTTALVAVAFLIVMPHSMYWMRDVMLEWPATFWILAAVWAYQRDLLGKHAAWAVVTWLAVLAAFLTKQTAGFIGLVIVLHTLLLPTRRAYWSRVATWTGFTLAGLGVATYVWITRDTTALASKLTSWSPDFAFYPRHIPEITGWLLIPVVIGSIVWLGLSSRSTAPLFLALTIALWFAFSSMISAKEPRYLFFALPFLSLSGSAAMGHPLRGNPTQPAWGRYLRNAVVLILLVQFWLGRDRWPCELPSYFRAALAVDSPFSDQLVLVDAVRDGQFIFNLYDNPMGTGRTIPLRASKLLYARAAREKYDYRQFVESPADIVALLDKYGIRYIVMESQLPDTPYRDADPPPRLMLRELVESDARFVRRLDQSLACGDASWKNVRLRVYEYTACPPRTSDSITFDMPGMGGSVTLKLPTTQPAK